MFQRLKAAWCAGRSGQPMPANADRTVGQTGAIIGITGLAVLVVFTTAYAFGAAEKKNMIREDEGLKELEKDAQAASAELRGDGETTAISAEETDVVFDDACNLDNEEEEEEAPLEQDMETGDISEREEETEPDSVDDLWGSRTEQEDDPKD